MRAQSQAVIAEVNCIIDTQDEIDGVKASNKRMEIVFASKNPTTGLAIPSLENCDYGITPAGSSKMN